MKKPKILIFAPTPPPFAGPEVATKQLIENLKQESINVVFLKSNLRKNNWDKGKFDITGIVKFLVLYMRFLLKIILNRTDKVYLLLSSGKVGFTRDAVLIISSKLLRNKVISHYRGGNFHNFYNNQSPFYKKFIKYTMNKVNTVIVQADILKVIFKDVFNEDKIRVLYNGIDLSGDNRNNIEKEFINNKCINLLFMGHIAYSKGFYHLICAFKEIYKEFNLCLKFAGTTRYSGEKSETQKGFLTGKGLDFYNNNFDLISNTIDDFVINDLNYNSKYLGIISGEEKKRAFMESDIFILPSFTEGFSVAVLEAMSYGLPVIVTNVGAFPEVISKEINGFIINKISIEDIKKTIIHAISDKSKLMQISRNNLKYVDNNFRVEKIANDFEKILIEA